MANLKSLIVCLLILCLSCVPEPKTPPILYDLGVARKEPIIFVKVDEDFNAEQKTHIARAFKDWEKASNYKISFQVTWDEPKPGPYWLYEQPSEDSGLFFWYLPKSANSIPINKLEEWENYIGLMVYGRGENSGNVIIFDNISEHQFYSVALHEIGHLLGLKHIKGYPVVMHPNALGDCLTFYDVQQLCDLYGCSPVSQCAADHLEDEPNMAIRTSSTLISETFSELFQSQPRGLLLDGLPPPQPEQGTPDSWQPFR